MFKQKGVPNKSNGFCQSICCTSALLAKDLRTKCQFQSLFVRHHLARIYSCFYPLEVPWYLPLLHSTKALKIYIFIRTLNFEIEIYFSSILIITSSLKHIKMTQFQVYFYNKMWSYFSFKCSVWVFNFVLQRHSAALLIEWVLFPKQTKMRSHKKTLSSHNNNGLQNIQVMCEEKMSW